jgi:polysulfide reductase chain C
MAQHFVHPPNWTWYIVSYFFLAGLAGGSYVLATILRLWGSQRDEAVIRLGYLLPLPLCVLCAIFLTLDLGRPMAFWHMLINTTPGNGGLNFKYWSPMSVGVWVLSIFGLFSLLAFLEGLGRLRPMPSIVTIVGSLFGLFLAGYTGVLLSVSNQPLWSDTYALGGLFLASGLSGSAALLVWFGHYVNGDPSTEARLEAADGYFAILELLFILAFFVTVAMAGTIGRTLSGIWIVLWILVLVSLIPAIRGAFTRTTVSGSGTVAIAQAAIVMPIVVLIGVFLMRIVIVFSAQF